MIIQVNVHRCIRVRVCVDTMQSTNTTGGVLTKHPTNRKIRHGLKDDELRSSCSKGGLKVYGAPQGLNQKVAIEKVPIKKRKKKKMRLSILVL